MNFNIGIVYICIIQLIFILNCGTPLSEREKCYKKEYCSTAVGDCFIGQTLFNSLFTPSSTSSSSSTSSDSGYISADSENGNTFATSSYLTYFPITSYSYYGIAGSMSSGSDVDIFYGSYTSGSSSSTTFSLSQESGTATCNAYSRTSYTSATNATIDGTFTLLGTLSSTKLSVTLNLSSSPYLYIVCTGSTAAAYEVRAWRSSSSSSSASSFYSTLNNLLFISCFSAKQTCIAECNKKHSF